MKNASENFVEIDGGRLHYYEAGGGIPIVLLHSNGSSAREYEGVMEQLAQSARVICLDYFGFGDSDGIQERFEIESIANTVAQFIRAKGLDRPIVGGSSLGGSISASFASRNPDLTRGVVLVETPCRSWEAWGQLWPFVEDLFAVPTQSLEQISPRFRDPTPQLLRRLNIDRNKAGGRLMMEAMWAIRDFDILAASSITVPTRLVVGKKGVVGDGVARLQELIPHAKLIEMDDCGHFPMVDDPAAFAAILADFLASEELA